MSRKLGRISPFEPDMYCHCGEELALAEFWPHMYLMHPEMCDDGPHQIIDLTGEPT